MSSPKEKAEELYCKYDSLFKAPFKKHQHLKESALIAVDEILKVASFYNDSQAEVTYWQEVKQEIEKL
jgi:hypothetical protein